ncbi:MAG: tetratricopeptide repeat protein, partial [Myxococcales bacterium]|nr:tetratricopeptide repeat protein [Myxococcales bacterium]
EGIVARASGREEAAREAFTSALDRLTELERGAGVEAAALLLEIGRSDAALGDTEAAVAALERSLAVARAAVGERHPAVAVRLSALASVKIRRRELEPAFALVLEARSIFEAAYGLEHPEIARAMIYEAQILKHEGELERAEGALARALAIDEGTIGEAPGTAAVILELVQLHLERVEPEHARPLLERARPIVVEAFGEESYEYGGVLRREAWASLQEGDSAGAVGLLRRAVELLERPGAPPLEELAEARWHLAYALAEEGAPRPEVDALARQALEEFERAGPVFFRPRAAIERWLGRD